jgi:hypothetical protein
MGAGRTQAAGLEIRVAAKGSTFVGKQITACVRVNPQLVVLELADGSQLQFRATDGELEVGAHVEPAN